MHSFKTIFNSHTKITQVLNELSKLITTHFLAMLEAAIKQLLHVRSVPQNRIHGFHSNNITGY